MDININFKSVFPYFLLILGFAIMIADCNEIKMEKRASDPWKDPFVKDKMKKNMVGENSKKSQQKGPSKGPSKETPKSTGKKQSIR